MFSLASGPGLIVIAIVIIAAIIIPIQIAAARRRRAIASGEIVLTDDTNVLAVVSFIGSFFIGLLGVIAGHIALSQIKRTNQRGWALAVAGVTIGYVAIAITIITIALLVVTALNR